MATMILIVGCGKMGEALLGGWLAESLSVDEVICIEPNRETAQGLRDRYAIEVIADAGSLAADVRPEAIVFAVKPQALTGVAGDYGRFAGGDCVFLSIAAGRTIAGLEACLPPGSAVVRTMPNTPAAVGRGASVACANAATSPAQRALCQRLLAAVGTVAWVEDEALLDAVTALSGSGPAYVFYFVECLAAAGVAAGLPRELADTLARQTVAGAGEMLARLPEPAATLRQNVTSPGGTTAAALQVLMGDEAGRGGLAPLMAEALDAAARRARDLAQ